MSDLCRCLAVLAEQVSSEGRGSVEAIAALLKRLYSQGGDITLSTVHKAKGLEWSRVTVLFPELMPLATGDAVEERCIQFVAYTRAQHTLRFAYGRQAWNEGLRIVGQTLLAGAPEPEMPAAPALRLATRPSAARPLTIDDERAMPLFAGSAAMDTPPLIDRLMLLAEDPRPALRAWASVSLTLLRRTPSRQVYADAPLLQRLEKAASTARLAIPAFGAAKPDSLRMLVFEGGLARWKYVQLKRRGPRVISVVFGGVVHRFDAKTGEALGLPFDPSNPYLDPKALEPQT
ncbi:3'-5' exonuclease [Deinococcus multiflagellatus]|uniref:3'-5' exonuclease n=1 Tax=Deinococcus multiflagellatus TaxID=1656887 RepID=A0ABW1ZND6_9DEIO